MLIQKLRLKQGWSQQQLEWIYWVIAGWGLGVAIHASRVFRPEWLLGPQWERREVEKRLGRPL